MRRLFLYRSELQKTNERLKRLLSETVRRNASAEERINRILDLPSSRRSDGPSSSPSNGTGLGHPDGSASCEQQEADTSLVSDEGLDSSLHLPDNIFQGHELDPENEALILGTNNNNSID